MRLHIEEPRTYRDWPIPVYASIELFPIESEVNSSAEVFPPLAITSGGGGASTGNAIVIAKVFGRM